MSKEKIDLRAELKSLKFKFGLLQRIPCSMKENKKYKQLLKDGQPLPEGIYRLTNEFDEFYTIHETDLSQEEINEYLTYKKLSFLKTIKNCALFFTILTITSFVLFLILFRFSISIV